MTRPEHDGAATAKQPPHANTIAESIVPVELLAPIDEAAASLGNSLVARVVVDDAGHQRSSVYRSLGPAQRAVRRAQERGLAAHVTLCRLVPVGVVTGLDGVGQ